MQTNESTPTYRVWGADNVAYGPVELPALVYWIRDERVTPDTWVFSTQCKAWQQAKAYPELKALFASQPSGGGAAATTQASARSLGIKPGSLRRIKVLAGMDERQLESFLQYMELVPCRQFSQLVRKGEHGDAMYLVLEGELRAYTIVDGKESLLSTMTTGDFFGEISLLDQGPRSANVVANRDSTLLRISAAAFDHLVAEAPALALPFLLALSRSVVGRVRTLTKRYEDSIHFSRTAGLWG
jgi:CRP-like cAMP-binding protein